MYNSTDLAADASEAAYVSSQPGLESIEIGNEPNRYPSADTDYQAYIDQWNTVYQDYVTDGGTAPVSGPGVANTGITTYIDEFLSQDASKLSAVTAHYYAGNGNESTATARVCSR